MFAIESPCVELESKTNTKLKLAKEVVKSINQKIAEIPVEEKVESKLNNQTTCESARRQALLSRRSKILKNDLMCLLGQLRSQSRNAIKNFQQVLSQKHPNRPRAFSPVPAAHNSHIFQEAKSKRKERIFSEGNEVEEEFMTNRSKMNSTSSEYFTRVYKHGIPLKSYNPPAASKFKISSKVFNKPKSSFQLIYEAPTMKGLERPSKVAEYFLGRGGKSAWRDTPYFQRKRFTQEPT